METADESRPKTHERTNFRTKKRPQLVKTLSFFSWVFSKTPRKTSKIPRIFLTVRTLKNPVKQAENTQKDQGNSQEEKDQGNKNTKEKKDRGGEKLGSEKST